MACKKDLDVLMDHKHNMSQQNNAAAKRAKDTFS